MNIILNTFIRPEILIGLLGPLVVGFIIWLLGERSIDRRLKNEAIRDLMTFRGDYASQNFRESLNRVSVIFHGDEEVRNDVRHLYEVLNNPSSQQKSIERTIVGLIYKLCQKNGFKGLSEYDIDQSFVVPQQNPDTTSVRPQIMRNEIKAQTVEEEKKSKSKK